jgi:hypothetical protein
MQTVILTSGLPFILIDRAELWFTVVFAVDIIIRFLVCLPRPGEFFDSKKNMVDLVLAVTTLIIQIPYIHHSHVYVYLTVFQVVRIYRPIIYVERLRSLIVRTMIMDPLSLYLPMAESSWHLLE